MCSDTASSVSSAGKNICEPVPGSAYACIHLSLHPPTQPPSHPSSAFSLFLALLESVSVQTGCASCSSQHPRRLALRDPEFLWLHYSCFFVGELRPPFHTLLLSQADRTFQSGVLVLGKKTWQSRCQPLEVTVDPVVSPCTSTAERALAGLGRWGMVGGTYRQPWVSPTVGHSGLSFDLAKSR